MLTPLHALIIVTAFVAYPSFLVLLHRWRLRRWPAVPWRKEDGWFCFVLALLLTLIVVVGEYVVVMGRESGL